MDLERRARIREMLQGRVLLAGLRIVQDGVTMTERSAFGILTRDADRRSLGEQRGKGKPFGQTPIDFAIRLQRGLALLELRDEFLIRRKSIGRCDQRIRPLQELAFVDTGGNGHFVHDGFVRAVPDELRDIAVLDVAVGLGHPGLRGILHLAHLVGR